MDIISTKSQKTIEVRYNLPAEIHKIVARKKRKLSIDKDRDVSMEEACIAIIRGSETNS